MLEREEGREEVVEKQLVHVWQFILQHVQRPNKKRNEHEKTKNTTINWVSFGKDAH